MILFLFFISGIYSKRELVNGQYTNKCAAYSQKHPHLHDFIQEHMYEGQSYAFEAMYKVLVPFNNWDIADPPKLAVKAFCSVHQTEPENISYDSRSDRTWITHILPNNLQNGNHDEPFGQTIIYDHTKVMTCTCNAWTTWSAYSACPVTCGQGIETRNRVCRNDPETGDAYNCPGHSYDSRTCDRGPCPSWNSWREWSECSKECGGGTQERTRGCLHGFGVSHCQTSGGYTAIEETQSCNEHECPTWQEWGQWSNCPTTCGASESIRSRTCSESGLCGIEGTMQPANDTQRIESRYCMTKECRCPDSSCWAKTSDGYCSLNASNSSCHYNLQCDSDMMSLEFVPRTLFPAAQSISDLYSRDSALVENCITQLNQSASPSMEEIHVWRSDLTSCGVQLSLQGDDLIFDAAVYTPDPGVKSVFNGINVFSNAADLSATIVSFSCQYQSSASTSSSAFNVTKNDQLKASITRQIGSFDDSLELKLYTNDSFLEEKLDDFKIGHILFAKVEWKIKTLQDKVRFYLKKCDVRDEKHSEDFENSICVIRDSCYSSVFEAKVHGNKTVSSEATFSYKSFSYDISRFNEQILHCRVQFCLLEDNVINCGSENVVKNETDCPKDGVYQHFNYLPFGKIDED